MGASGPAVVRTAGIDGAGPTAGPGVPDRIARGTFPLKAVVGAYCGARADSCGAGFAPEASFGDRFFLSACPAGRHGPFSRGFGTTSFRQGEFGASTPLYRKSGKRGGGVIAESRAKSSSGVITRCLARPARAYFTRSAMRPHRRLEGREPAQLERERQHELAHGNIWQNAIHKMGRATGHAPARTARTDPAIFARVGDEQIVAARVAVAPHESMREHAALQVRAELFLDVARQRFLVRLTRVSEKRLEARTHDAVEHGLRWTAGGESGREACQTSRCMAIAVPASARGFSMSCIGAHLSGLPVCTPMPPPYLQGHAARGTGRATLRDDASYRGRGRST
jgi:hypothetical protein